MAYETRLFGEFTFVPPLSGEALAAFRDLLSRRHARDDDPNEPVDGAPSLYCPFEIDETGTSLRLSAVHSSGWSLWLERIVDRELRGSTLTGDAYWRGEDPRDQGIVTCHPGSVCMRSVDSDPIVACIARLDSLDNAQVLSGIAGLGLLGAGTSIHKYVEPLLRSEDERIVDAARRFLAGETSAPAAPPPTNLIDVAIEELDLSVRAMNELSNAGFRRTTQLIGLDDRVLIVDRGVSERAVRELREVLAMRS